MTFDPYGYTDPYQQAGEQQSPFPVVPQQPDMPAVPGGPMAGFQQSYAQVMQGAAPQGLRREPMAESWLKGALLGLGAWLIWRHLKARKQATGQYFRRGTRAAFMWILITIVGAVAAHILWPGSFWMATGAFCAAGFIWGQIYGRAMRPASEKRAGGHRR